MMLEGGRRTEKQILELRETILKALAEHGPMSRGRFADVLHVSERSLERQLHVLRTRGMVDMVTATTGKIRWCLTSQLAQMVAERDAQLAIRASKRAEEKRRRKLEQIAKRHSAHEAAEQAADIQVVQRIVPAGGQITAPPGPRWVFDLGAE